MESKFSHLEYKGKDYPVIHAYVLAIGECDHSVPPSKPGRFQGLNMAIVTPTGTLGENFKETWPGCFDIILHGKDGSKIPIEIHGGTGGRPDKKDTYGYGQGTECWFGYVGPLTFDERFDPKHREWLKNNKAKV